MFDHEKFEGYRLSITYWEVILELLEKIPPGNFLVKDQVKRAASSIALNIADGCGRSKVEDRKRFYAIARGSAMECAAASDLLVRMQPHLSAEILESKKILHSIVCILSTIILKGQG
jgi:four helix bundle protein